jgi:hypothetical protein
MNTVQRLLAGQIRRACELIFMGNYEASLATIVVTRSYDSENEFLHFLEHRFEKLCEEAKQQTLSQEDRKSFVRSMRVIIAEALEKAADAPGTNEKESYRKALEAIKQSLFTRAEHYIGREEYRFAMTEIQRVYILDPGNLMAKQFEHRLKHLIASQDARKIPANSDNVFVIEATRKPPSPATRKSDS